MEGGTRASRSLKEQERASALETPGWCGLRALREEKGPWAEMLGSGGP